MKKWVNDMLKALEVWIPRYLFLLMVWVVAMALVMLFMLFCMGPIIDYLFTGEWGLDSPEVLFRYWLTPVTIGLVIATPVTAQHWYNLTPGHPIKKFIYAALFCALVGVFDFAFLIPWGRDMVPHLVQWWSLR